LLAVLASIVRKRDHDEATFYRLEYRGQECPPHYTSARDAQQGIERHGPPPLGL
jgi:hypothetical protein